MNRKMIQEHEKEVNQLLSLGSLHEEIEVKKQKKKIKKIPVLMIFCGILMIVSGYFYNDIVKFLGKSISKLNEKKEVKIDGKTILTCNKKTSDISIGIDTLETTTYTFENDLLKKLSVVIEKSIHTNKEEIGYDNLKIINDKYKPSVDAYNSVEGLSSSAKNKKDTLLIKYSVDFDLLNVSLIPKSDYFIIKNTKDQPYRTIKEQEGRSGNICTVK